MWYYSFIKQKLRIRGFMQLFEPISVKSCIDVSAEIKKVCDLYALKEDLVSFDILHINTLYRGETKKDFSVLPPEEYVNILGNEERYNQNDFDIKQVYDIVLRGLKEGDLAPFVKLHMDNECYELSLELKEGLEVREDDEFFTQLYEQITREKIVKNVIVRLFGADTQQEIQSLKELFSSLSIKGKLESPRKMVISKAGGFVPSLSGTFNFILKEEWNKTRDKPIEFASYAAKSGDLVGLAIKAQAGVSGRNLRGEYIHAKKQESMDLEIKMGYKEGEFRSEEKEGVIEYYAAQDGYVGLGEGELKILVDFNLSEITTRTSGSLLGGDKKGFVVEVSCADANQDAVGAGIVLEAGDIKIFGSVAENATIVANKLEINGQTHQSTLIRAKEATIDIHKGSVKAEKVRVKCLELGSIEGEEVFVEQANGGNIKARDVVIDNLYSHTKIAISHNAHIKNMNGGENQFLISSRTALKTQEEKERIDTQLNHNFQAMNAFLQVLNKDLALVRKTKPVVNKIKIIMEENKKNNKPNERNITDSIAQYVTLLHRTKYLKDQLIALKQESKVMNDRLESLDIQAREATITLDVPWQGNNEVMYESFFPESKDIIRVNDGENVNISIDKEQGKLQKVERQ